jgi:hypothetical protein
MNREKALLIFKNKIENDNILRFNIEGFLFCFLTIKKTVITNSKGEEDIVYTASVKTRNYTNSYWRSRYSIFYHVSNSVLILLII